MQEEDKDERPGTDVHRAAAPQRDDPGIEKASEIATGSTLADISIRNHVFAWMLMASLIGFGLICFTPSMEVTASSTKSTTSVSMISGEAPS